MKTISVIIPVYNEEKTIETLLTTIRPIMGKCEILIVDGGSTDKTLEKIPPNENYRLIKGPKGRARQMNLGVLHSKGEILFFLHCDSELPENTLEEIRQVMATHRVGCFGIAFHSRNIWMKCCQAISNHRIIDRKVMFGDQGIFIDRKLFLEIGGFPDLPIMEDYQLSLTLKERNEKIGMTKHKIYTSDRRFLEGGRLRVMWKMNRLRAAYRKGVDMEEISRRYKDVR